MDHPFWEKFNAKNQANHKEAKNGPISDFFWERGQLPYFQTVIDRCVYNIHPIHNRHATSKDDQIVHIEKQLPNNGNKQRTGYLKCCVRGHGDKNQKTFCSMICLGML